MSSVNWEPTIAPRPVTGELGGMTDSESVEDIWWVMVYPYEFVVNKWKLKTATESNRKSSPVTYVVETAGLWYVDVIIAFRSGVIVVGEVI